MWTAMIARVRGPILASIWRGIERVRPRVDVDEDGDAELLEDRLPRPGEGERRRDDLVARPQVDAVEGGMDGGRTGVEEQAGRAPDERRPLVLEGGRFGGADAAEDLPVEDAHDRGLVLWPDVGPAALQPLGDTGAIAGFHGSGSVLVRRDGRSIVQHGALAKRPRPAPYAEPFRPNGKRGSTA